MYTIWRISIYLYANWGICNYRQNCQFVNKYFELLKCVCKYTCTTTHFACFSMMAYFGINRSHCDIRQVGIWRYYFIILLILWQTHFLSPFCKFKLRLYLFNTSIIFIARALSLLLHDFLDALLEDWKMVSTPQLDTSNLHCLVFKTKDFSLPSETLKSTREGNTLVQCAYQHIPW